jgi:hypothetical protein
MNDNLLLIAAVAVAGFFVGMGYANKQRQAADTASVDPGMDWLTTWGGGWR